MKQQIFNNEDDLIFEGNFNTFVEAVEAAVIEGVSLRGANLEGASLIGANLIDADLIDASLIGANLRYANLIDADLRYANLRYANLEGANLIGTTFEGTKGIYLFNKHNGRTCYAVEYENCLMIQAGCFWGTLYEFEAQCKEEYPNCSIETYAAQIEYLRKLSEELYK